jgi:hypothetical protein
MLVGAPVGSALMSKTTTLSWMGTYFLVFDGIHMKDLVVCHAKAFNAINMIA